MADYLFVEPNILISLSIFESTKNLALLFKKRWSCYFYILFNMLGFIYRELDFLMEFKMLFDPVGIKNY